MLMIITIHLFCHGGMNKEIGKLSLESVLLGFIYAASRQGVNLFALISGYYLSTKKNIKIRKLSKVYIQTLFYSVVIAIVLRVTGIKSIGIGSLINSCFPVSTKMYWYITAYVGLYGVSPYLNILINNLDKHQHLLLCIFLIIGFSFWDDITPYTDPLFASNGFSFIWLVVLYIIAAYIRAYVKSKEYKLAIPWVVMVLVLEGSLYILSMASKRIVTINRFLEPEYFFRYNVNFP